MPISTNFYLIEIPHVTFNINRLPFIPGRLGELREKYNSSHSFFRNGDYIYISPMANKEPTLGKTSHILVANNLSIVSSLVKHVFFRKFRETYPNILPLSFYPFRFLSRREQDDQLANRLPDHLRGKISRKKLIEIQFRDIIHDGKKKLFAVINFKSRWLIDMNCAELNDQGFNLLGRQVLTSESIPGLEGILAPDETLIGSIKAINGNFASVETSEEITSYPLDQIFLNKSYHNIQDLLTFYLDEKSTDRIFAEIKQIDTDFFDAENYYREINKVAQIISQIKFANLDGFSFSISKSPLNINSQFSIQQPSFLFDYTPGASEEKASKGLTDYGPYDSSTFSPKSPKILVVCQRSSRGGFTEFVGKLRNGIPSSYYFKGGMVGKYRLHDIIYDVVEIDSPTAVDYKQKISEYIRNSSEPPDAAILETSTQFYNLPDNQNPYYVAKAYLLSLGIPAQFVKNENIRGNDQTLQWICDSIALQLYAKLGGTPWVLPVSSSIDHEIVVGIGSTIQRENVFAGSLQERIVAFTTFFTGDGRYILGNRCRDVSYDAYFDELLTNLRQSIIEISREYGWQNDATIRIVFHIFKPIKNIEAEVVERLLDEFEQYDIKYCFVTITDKHPFLMFDMNKPGRGYHNLGKYVPSSKENWILDEYSCVLQIIGSEGISFSGHRFSSPVLIRIHENSTYKDLNSIVQQVYNFTNLSWRGFKQSQQPATIFYSDLMAQKLSKLRNVDSWNSDVVSTLLRHKKWFL
jgi:hypothetical protein